MDNPHISPSPSPEASDRELLAEELSYDGHFIAGAAVSQGSVAMLAAFERAIARARSESASEIARLTAEVGALREALEPFAALAGPINGEAGRISILESIEGKDGTGELYLGTHFGTNQEHTLWSDGFRKARSAIRSLKADSNG